MPPRKKQRRTSRVVLQTLLIVALLACSGWLTVSMERKKEDGQLPSLDRISSPSASASPTPRALSYVRLKSPARTVVRDGDGSVVATFTDGARTAVLTGPSRTFSEPSTTDAKVVTDDWVRLLPKPWHKGAERDAWFTGWFHKYRGSTADDVFAYAYQYTPGAPEKKNAKGVPYRGDADFGPVSPPGSRYDIRLEQSDFYDYLGVPWTFPDGVTEYPEQARFRAMDCSGFVRTVYGYRAGYPLNSTDDSHGTGLPRTANGIAQSNVGVDILPLKRTGSTVPLKMYARPTLIDSLQPGDLLFWKLDSRTGARLDHTGIYLGLDTAGHPRFISSRKEVNGPTMGDTGGAARLDGPGMYAQYLSSAKRL
jgi:cell wall-associated NlpC family hydrolase